MAEFTADDAALLAELGVAAQAKPAAAWTPREERIIAGFEEVQRFVDAHGRAPQHGEGRDIFERLYAVRLDRLRVLDECRSLLAPLDRQGLLSDAAVKGIAWNPDALDDAALLTALGLGDTAQTAPDDITRLRHVRSAAEKRDAERRAAEEVAGRKPCKDFEAFRPLFQRVERDLATGLRQAQPIAAGNRDVEAGDFFVLDGVMLYIADVGEPLKTTAGEVDRRLRVIFANGTESNLLLRSLQRAFYDDPAARRLVSPEGGQLSFGDAFEPDDVASGTIYVLRSRSELPYIAQHRDLIHKIGVTGGRVEARITGAEHDATYLLAAVEVVATYRLAGINRTKMERLFHRLFGPARLNITIHDRFGQPVQPEEWYLVPLFVIDEVVDRIKDGTITDYAYDPATASLTRREP